MIIQPGNNSAVVDQIQMPVATTPIPSGSGSKPNSEDQIAISGKAKETYKVRENVRKNDGIRDQLVAKMRKQLERNPYPAGAVADILADKIINGWGKIGQTG